MVLPLASVSAVRLVDTVMTAPVIVTCLIWLWLMAGEMFPFIGIENSCRPLIFRKSDSPDRISGYGMSRTSFYCCTGKGSSVPICSMVLHRQTPFVPVEIFIFMVLLLEVCISLFGKCT